MLQFVECMYGSNNQVYLSAGRPRRQHDAVFALVVGSAGLLLVDHIHFQYNGLLIGGVAKLIGADMRAARPDKAADAAMQPGLNGMAEGALHVAFPLYRCMQLRTTCKLVSDAGQLVDVVKLMRSL